MRKLIPALCALLICHPAAAQQQPFDCEASAPHRAFDFWLGKWEVTDPQGKVAGHNTITKAERGCALREQWTSVRGGTGQSLNYFQPGNGVWRQLWLDGGSSIIDISGGLEGDSMVLTGTIFYLKAGTDHPFRGRWTPLEDGRVRQFFQQQDAEGAWQTWFEGFYSRASDEAH